jgi:hypothetical protein
MLLLIWLVLLGEAWGRYFCYTADWNGYILQGTFLLPDANDTNMSPNYGNYTVQSRFAIRVPNQFQSQGASYTVQITNDAVSEYVEEVVDEIYISARNMQMTPVIWMDKFAILSYHEIAIHFFTLDLNILSSDRFPDMLDVSMFPDYHVIYVEGFYRSCPTCDWYDVTYVGNILSISDCTPTASPTWPLAASLSPTISESASQTPSEFPLLSPSSSGTPAVSEISSMSPSGSGTPAVSEISSMSPSASGTPTVSVMPSVSASTSGTPAVSEISSVSPSASETPTVSEISSVSPSASETPTVSEISSVSPSASGTPAVYKIPSQTINASNNTSASFSNKSELGSAELNASANQTIQPSSAQQNNHIYVIVGVVLGFLCILAFVAFVILRKRRRAKAKTRLNANPRRQNFQEADVLSFSKQSEKVSYQNNPFLVEVASVSGSVASKNSVQELANKQSLRAEHLPCAIPSDFKEFHIPSSRPEYNPIGKAPRHKFNPIKKVIAPVRPAYEHKKDTGETDSDLFHGFEYAYVPTNTPYRSQRGSQSEALFNKQVRATPFRYMQSIPNELTVKTK